MISTFSIAVILRDFRQKGNVRLGCGEGKNRKSLCPKPVLRPDWLFLQKNLIYGNFLLTDSLKLGMKLKACSHGGVEEDFFFLPTVHSFTRELGESILVAPSGFSVNACFRHRTSVNRKDLDLGTITPTLGFVDEC